MSDVAPREYKLVFAGSLGAGKTTAIRAISEIEPVRTDVAQTEVAIAGKTTTTVAMDYGRVTLPGGDVLRLYGTPGQDRFRFMWSILADGALGVVVLVDASRPDPLADLRLYLDAFQGTAARSRAVIGVGRRDAHPSPALDAYVAVARECGVDVPVLSVDVRRRADVLLLLDVLFSQIEAAEAEELAAFEADGCEFAGMDARP